MKINTILIISLLILVLNGCDQLIGDTITLEDNERAVYMDQNGDARLLLPGEESVSSRFHHVIYSDEIRTYSMTSTPNEGERIYSEDPFEISIGEQRIVLVELTLMYHYELDQILDLHKEWVLFDSEEAIASDLIRPVILGTARSHIQAINEEEYMRHDWDEIENEVRNELVSVLLEEGIIVDSFRINSITEK